MCWSSYERDTTQLYRISIVRESNTNVCRILDIQISRSLRCDSDKVQITEDYTIHLIP